MELKKESRADCFLAFWIPMITIKTFSTSKCEEKGEKMKILQTQVILLMTEELTEELNLSSCRKRTDVCLLWSEERFKEGRILKTVFLGM